MKREKIETLQGKNIYHFLPREGGRWDFPSVLSCIHSHAIFTVMTVIMRFIECHFHSHGYGFQILNFGADFLACFFQMSWWINILGMDSWDYLSWVWLMTVEIKHLIFTVIISADFTVRHLAWFYENEVWILRNGYGFGCLGMVSRSQIQLKSSDSGGRAS